MHAPVDGVVFKAVQIRGGKLMSHDYAERLTVTLETARNNLMNEILTNELLGDARHSNIRERVAQLRDELSRLAADASMQLRQP